MQLLLIFGSCFSEKRMTVDIGVSTRRQRRLKKNQLTKEKTMLSRLSRVNASRLIFTGRILFVLVQWNRNLVFAKDLGHAWFWLAMFSTFWDCSQIGRNNTKWLLSITLLAIENWLVKWQQLRKCQNAWFLQVRETWRKSWNLDGQGRSGKIQNYLESQEKSRENDNLFTFVTVVNK